MKILKNIKMHNRIMKSLNSYIFEKLKIKKTPKNECFKPNVIGDLVEEIKRRINNSNSSILDLSNIDCSNLDSLENLFRHVFKITNSGNDMSNIKILNVSNWNVSSITNFEYCFTRLDNIEYIEGLDTWDMRNANTINAMFSNCRQLKELDLSEWELHLSEKETFGHRTIEAIFLSCHNLEKIKGLENWTFGKATTLKSIFKNCKTLKTIEGIENWNVSNIDSIYGMFENMESLSKLDLSQWDVRNLRNCFYFVKGCTSLTTIGDISKWNVQRLYDLNGMFDGCKNLVCDISDWNISISCIKTNAFKYTNSKIFKKPNVFKK